MAQVWQDMIQKRGNRKLLAKINAVYADAYPDDAQHLRAMKDKYRQILDGEEW
ncbi:MAG: hypothetical protein KDE54_33265 [Caldilineaceae bacterium]|nr:hypothetical protein [Caldilineaceae bacterium]MCB0146023.1 hypothetical protein [Caldilineaceae bacterium]MCB9156721.1 hypothetical protein [Caldilineaceae bacterium]